MEKKEIVGVSICVIFWSIFGLVLACHDFSSPDKIKEKRSIELIEESNELFYDCKEYCTEKKWNKAYSAVNKLRMNSDKAQTSSYDSNAEIKCSELYEEGKKYVVLQEAMVVLEEKGNEGIMRIIGIAKERDAEDFLYDELLDVAIKIGNEDLEETIRKLKSK